MNALLTSSSRVLRISSAILSSVVLGGVLHAGTGDWEDGDLFVRTSTGSIRVYAPTGELKETLPAFSGFSFFAGGLALGPNGQDLYSATWGQDVAETEHYAVGLYGHDHPHAITPLFSGVTDDPVYFSIVFDAQGNFYTPGGSGGVIEKYSAAGALLDTFDVGGTPGHLVLAPDQRTLFYYADPIGMRRYDLLTHTQLADYSSVLTGHFCLLPPFDGTGGAIASGGLDIKRMDAGGAVIQTYDLPGQNAWYFVELDPNGTSFWAPGRMAPRQLHRFDVATGSEDAPSIPLGLDISEGLMIRRAAQGGTTPAQFDAPTPCASPVTTTAGLPVSFAVQASDINDGDVVDLTVSGLPSGATLTPGLPSSGNPLSVNFDWIPNGTQVGIHFVTFTATDFVGHETTCTVMVTVEGPGDAYCFGDGLDPVVTAVCPCTNFGDPGRGCANSNGSLGGGRLYASGSTSPNTVLLTCDGIPNGALATFMRGPNHDPQGAVFGDGIKCLTSPLFRFGSQNAGTIGNPPSTVEVGAPNEVPGATVHYFVQYRNSVPGFCATETFNASNGYTISW